MSAKSILEGYSLEYIDITTYIYYYNIITLIYYYKIWVSKFGWKGGGEVCHYPCYVSQTLNIVEFFKRIGAHQNELFMANLIGVFKVMLNSLLLKSKTFFC